MQRIIIKEQDSTNNVETLSSYDVAYVPGFSTKTGDDLAALYRKPKLFTNKYAFIKAIGSDVPTFASSCDYSNTAWGGLESGEKIWSDNCHGTENFVSTNDADRGYRYALYLLSLGMPVYYEVMNNSTSASFENDTFKVTAINTETTAFNADATYYVYGSYSAEGEFTATSGLVPANVHRTVDAEGFEGFSIARKVEAENPENIFLPLTSFDDLSEDITAVYTISSTPINNTASHGIHPRSMYDGLINRFGIGSADADNSFDSLGDYSVKFITSGGYPTFEYLDNALASSMIDMAYTRGDAIALIDHTDFPSREIYPTEKGGDGTAVIDIVRNEASNLGANQEYGAMFTPWYECSNLAIAGVNGDANLSMPGSLAYLSALAVQLRDYNPWLAVAGVTRGKVPSATGLHLSGSNIMTNNIADSYQSLPSDAVEGSNISINPITYIRNVGYCIWGNRTLRVNESGTRALSFLNIRNVVSDVKKIVFETSQNTLFEQNTDVTWLNFKSSITPLLDRMVSNYILSDYSITRYLIDPMTGDEVPAYKVLATIKIQPINSIEVIDLTVELQNNDVTTTEM